MKRRSFSLIEIMLVVVIIGLIAGLVVTHIDTIGDEAKQSLTKTAIKKTDADVQLYRMMNKRAPTTEEGLEALTKGPKPLADEIPKDGWENELKYGNPSSREGKNFDVYSYGRDANAGGEGFDADLYN